MLSKLINRFKEPSTYAGLAGAAILLGASADEYTTYTNAAAGFFAFLAIIVAETGDA